MRVALAGLALDALCLGFWLAARLAAAGGGRAGGLWDLPAWVHLVLLGCLALAGTLGLVGTGLAVSRRQRGAGLGLAVLTISLVLVILIGLFPGSAR